MLCYILLLTLMSPYFTNEAVGKERGDQLIFLPDNAKEISLLDLKTGLKWTIERSEQEVVAVDFHLSKQLLFWATRSKINRCELPDCAKVEQVVESEGVEDLAVDWIHDRLYWTDSKTGQLEVARLDGSSRQVLFTHGQPTSVAVDPLHGILFWIESNNTRCKIQYANLDGTYPMNENELKATAPILWESNHLFPSSPLAVNPQSQELYFLLVVQGQTTAMAVNYHLMSQRVAINTWSWSPGFAVLEGRVYWSNSSAVYWTVDGGREVNIVTKHLRNIRIMEVMSLELQPRTTDQCESNNCEHECFVVKDLPTCACHFGYSLKTDLRTCQDDGFAVLYTSDSFYRVTLPSDFTKPYQKIQKLYHHEGSRISAVDVHVRYNFIFWSDTNSAAIYVASLEKAWDPQLVVKTVAKSIAVDWLHDHLYWTEDTRVHMSTLDGKLQTVVAEDPQKPHSIVVDPRNRLLFWSTCNWEMVIVKAALDGSKREELVTKYITCARSLAVDSANQLLFWVDYFYNIVSSVRYNGKVRHDVYEPRALSLAVIGRRLLWTSARDDSLFINQSSLSIKVPIGFYAIGVVVHSRSRQLGGPNYCQDADCEDMCVSAPQVGEWICMCAGGHQLANNSGTCLTPQDEPQDSELNSSKLKVLDYDSNSVELNCSEIPYAQKYVITLQQSSSRFQSQEHDYDVKVATNSFPISVKGLKPATTYSVTVEPHPTYLGVLRTQVSTSPPHLRMSRLTEVYKPWNPVPVQWAHELNIYDLTFQWRSLIREYFLLQFPQIELIQMEEVETQIKPKALLDRLRKQLAKIGVTQKFIVLAHYKNKVMFDRDSTMTLWNTPFGVEFFLAMVQVSEYNGAYGVDITLSETTDIPWPS